MLVGKAVCAVAVYCQRCGQLHVHDLPYFIGERSLPLNCGNCGHREAVFWRVGAKKASLSIPCVACGHKEFFSYALRDLHRVHRERLLCQHDHFELGYIGRRRTLEELIAHNRAAFMKATGLPTAVTQHLLLEAFNRAHDLIAAGEIHCPRCGGTHLLPSLQGNAIALECLHCGRIAYMPMQSPAHLARLHGGARLPFLYPASKGLR